MSGIKNLRTLTTASLLVTVGIIAGFLKVADAMKAQGIV